MLSWSVKEKVHEELTIDLDNEKNQDGMLGNTLF